MDAAEQESAQQRISEGAGTSTVWHAILGDPAEVVERLLRGGTTQQHPLLREEDQHQAPQQRTAPPQQMLEKDRHALAMREVQYELDVMKCQLDLQLSEIDRFDVDPVAGEKNGTAA
jgi:hypothetical protein